LFISKNRLNIIERLKSRKAGIEVAWKR
jgi:hypothetical protein